MVAALLRQGLRAHRQRRLSAWREKLYCVCGTHWEESRNQRRDWRPQGTASVSDAGTYDRHHGGRCVKR